MPTGKCSKCGSGMEEGLVVDLNYAGILRSMWVDELAVVGSGPNTPEVKRKLMTTTYRCTKCGFLDSYAK